MRRNEYTLCSSKVKSDKNIAIVSDLHISENSSETTLTEVLDTLDDIDPTHIVIPGDLYNVDMTTIADNKVTNFVNTATEIAPVYYVKGNTEDLGSILNYRILPNGMDKGINERLHILGEDINGEQKDTFEESDLCISGLRLPEEFYKLCEYDKTNMLFAKYQFYLERLFELQKKYNILLCHDPIIKDMLDLMEVINEHSHGIDLVISGHNHGGMIPEKIQPLFKPFCRDLTKLFPSYTKGAIPCGENGMMIVSEGVTKYHSEMGILEKLERYHEGTIENVRIRKKD